MANITKRMTKSGAAYRIKVSLGYDETYKQITKSMTFKPNISGVLRWAWTTTPH